MIYSIKTLTPFGPNQVCAGHITYLKTGEGWMYLAIVMDLYSRRIIGWETHKRMTTNLVDQALMRAIKLKQPKRGVVFHSDHGSRSIASAFANC
ncbi:MAG: putative transposase [Arenicella sp.]|jgi:putative transposase